MDNIISAGTYNIFIGSHVFEQLRTTLISARYRDVKKFILTDENISTQWMEFLIENVPELEDSEMIQIESGEENKVIEICMEVWKILNDHNADRKSILINFGGGVISDLGGFVASTYKRGIDFLNVPTTLLSQVDASIGGKVGVDFLSFKNLIGIFKDPVNVYIYPGFLSTISKKQLLSGFAEIIKHSLIAEATLWEEIINTNVEDIASIESLINSSLNIKNNIVANDPFERGLRKILNFGHTIGHAIESYSLSNDEVCLLHGEAVAIGIICEAYISHKISGLSEKELSEIVIFIKSIYAPYLLDIVAADGLIALMNHDKKNENSRINFTLLNKIGKAVIDQQANEDLIRESLNFYNREISGIIALN